MNDAPRRWWNRLDKSLQSYSLIQTRVDSCCYDKYEEVPAPAGPASARARRLGTRLRDFVARGEVDKSLHELPQVIAEASQLALVGARERRVRGLRAARGRPKLCCSSCPRTCSQSVSQSEEGTGFHPAPPGKLSRKAEEKEEKVVKVRRRSLLVGRRRRRRR